jgi:hypothetical protein
MREDPPSFRQFYEELFGDAAFDVDAASDVLWSWLDPALALLEPLRAYGAWDAHAQTYRRRRNQVDEQMPGDLWELYAFSRVSDLLLLPYQRGTHDGSAWTGPAIGSDKRVAFFTALGLKRIDQPDFHPFFHEIVAVDQAADAASPITVVEERWPGFMLGHLLICRAGVHVRGGTDHILKEVAENSTLYWAHRRKHRPYRDLAQGWGSNSQWRTRFRRDYTDGRDFVYNADGTLDARLPDPEDNPEREELSADERVELLINRCFVYTLKPHDDRYPYDDTLTTSGLE